MKRVILLASLAISIAALAADASPPDHPFPESWIDGTGDNEPPYQAHEYSPGTWIIRQSLQIHFEAPFLYLLAGTEKALLLDAGAPAKPWLRKLVEKIIGDDYPLIVAHSHAHGDHVGGDGEFEKRRNTEIVGHSAEEVADFFGIGNWPHGTAGIDLGDRPLLIIPIPGHEPSSIAIHDHQTGILLTGDSLYPGRLYVRDFEAYRRSVERITEILPPEHVSWVLGAHIEMTDRPGMDFGPMQSRHPNERKLELEWRHVLELKRLLWSMDEARYTPRSDFILYPVD